MFDKALSTTKITNNQGPRISHLIKEKKPMSSRDANKLEMVKSLRFMATKKKCVTICHQRISFLKGNIILFLMSVGVSRANANGIIYNSRKYHSMSNGKIFNPPLQSLQQIETEVNEPESDEEPELKHERIKTIGLPFLSRRNGAAKSVLSLHRGGAQLKKPPSSANYGRNLENVVARDMVVSKTSMAKNASTQSSLNNETSHHTSPYVFLLIRLLFLTYYGSLGSLMPYLPVYYHSLGHGGQAIGLLGAVKPLTTFLVAPMWGVISDSSPNPSFILQFTFATSLILQLLLPLRDDVRYLVGMGFLTALLNAPVKSLIDSMVLNKLNEEDRGQYGKLRLWGQLGFGLGSSGVGILLSRASGSGTTSSSGFSKPPAVEKLMHDAVDVTVEGAAAAAAMEQITKTALETLSDFVYSAVEALRNISGYQIAFLVHGLLSIPAFFCMRMFQRIDIPTDENMTKAYTQAAKQKCDTIKKKDSSQIIQGLNLLFHNSDALLFFFLVFVVGTSSGIIENFAYVRIREVGGTGKEMGLSRMVSSAAGAPMFWFSGPLTEMLGADRVLVFSLLSYVVRFFIYALMKNPYQGLPAEALRGVTFAAFWSTGTVFAHRISPPGMSATMLMFLNAMYGGLGQSLGAIIGGKLQSKFGTVKAFIFSGIFDFCFVCVVLVYLSLRKESNFRNPTSILPSEEQREE